MSSRPPLQGYNHNIGYKKRKYHVQTEDSGLENPHVFTHLFHQGAIIASAKTDYADLAQEEDHEPALKKLMQEQHKRLMKQLRRGEFDEKIAAMLGSLEPAEEAAPAEAAEADQAAEAAAAEAAAAEAEAAAAGAAKAAAAEAAEAAAAEAKAAEAQAAAEAAAQEAAAAEAAAQEAAAQEAAAAEAAAQEAAAREAAAQEAAAREAAAREAALQGAAAEAASRTMQDAPAVTEAPTILPSEIPYDGPISEELPAPGLAAAPKVGAEPLLPEMWPPAGAPDPALDHATAEEIADEERTAVQKSPPVHEPDGWLAPDADLVDTQPEARPDGAPTVRMDIPPSVSAMAEALLEEGEEAADTDRYERQLRQQQQRQSPVDGLDFTLQMGSAGRQQRQQRQRPRPPVQVETDGGTATSAEDAVIVDRPLQDSSTYQQVRPQPSSGVFGKPLPEGANPQGGLPPMVEMERRAGVRPAPGGAPRRPPHPDPTMRRAPARPLGSTPQRYTAPSAARRSRFQGQRERRITGSYEARQAPPRPTAPPQGGTAQRPAVRRVVPARPVARGARPPARPVAPSRPLPRQGVPSRPLPRQQPPAVRRVPPAQPTAKGRAPAVVARPAVIVDRPREGRPPAAAPPAQRPAPQPPRARSRSLPNLFGSDLISERSLDEVILQYLAEDGEKE